VVVYTVILGMKRNKPPVAAVVVTPVVTTTPPMTAAGDVSPGAVGVVSSDSSGPANPAPSAGVPPPLPPVVSAATLPRAGFWIRIAASALDALIVWGAWILLPHFWKLNPLLMYAIYCTILWALRGTTVGGVVCNLKVVRLDDRPLDWPTALVRALAGFLSFFAIGLGFIWVAFDDQKQSWHDKIAGTTVVQVPKGVSLV